MIDTTKNKIALIDVDILLFFASYDIDEIHIAKSILTNKINSILDKVGAEQYELFVGGYNNFRYLIDDNYKANRKGVEKPLLFYDLKKLAIEQLQSFVANGVETDDVITATARYIKENTDSIPIICSIDKDFLTKEGYVYAWARKNVSDRLSYTDKMTAEFNFAVQMLVGDRADNILVCSGIGNKTAEKMLKGKSRFAMLLTLVRTYKKFYRGDWKVKLIDTYRLLYLVDNYERIKIPKEFKFNI